MISNGCNFRRSLPAKTQFTHTRASYSLLRVFRSLFWCAVFFFYCCHSFSSIYSGSASARAPVFQPGPSAPDVLRLRRRQETPAQRLENASAAGRHAQVRGKERGDKPQDTWTNPGNFPRNRFPLELTQAVTIFSAWLRPAKKKKKSVSKEAQALFFFFFFLKRNLT